MTFLSYFFVFLFQLYLIKSENINSNNNITAVIETFKLIWPIDDWKKYGYFSDSYILEINLHWLKYSPPLNIYFYFVGGLYIVIMFFGVSGNVLVIYLFIKCKSLRTSANILIVNLAISDGLMTIKAPILIYNSFLKGPALGDKACRLYGFLGGLTGTISIITLSVISYDRYFVIRFPLNRSFSNVRVKLCLIVTWIYGSIFALIPVLDIGFGKYTYEGYLTSCSFDYLTDDLRIKKFIISFFVAAWLIPFTLISFSYINIFKVVSNRNASNKRSSDSFRNERKENNKKQEIKLAKVVFLTIILWFLSWTPYAIVALLGVTDHKDIITPLTSMLPAIFCKTASCVNPYVYALSHPKFKTELKKMFCRSLKIKTDKSEKIWTTEYLKEEIQIKGNVSNNIEPLEFPCLTPSSRRKRPLKRQNTIIELICLRPSIENKSSTFRTSTESNLDSSVDDDSSE